MGQENINSLFRNVSAVPPGPSSIISSNQNSDSNPLSPYSSTQTLDSNPLAPPPELSYNQKERLVESIQSWEKSHGYPISTRVLSFKNQAFTYQFDKSGEYKPSKDTSKLKKKNQERPIVHSGYQAIFQKDLIFGWWRLYVQITTIHLPLILPLIPSRQQSKGSKRRFSNIYPKREFPL